jgi:hypothetical protein
MSCHADSKHIFESKIYSNLMRNLKFLNPRPVFLSILTLCVMYDMKTAI